MTDQGLRLALMLCVCEGEREMAIDAVASVAHSASEHRLSVFIVDDASPSEVGVSVASWAKTKGLEAQVRRLERPLGFRGCLRRTTLGLGMVADNGPVDLVIKIDPDTLITRRGLGAVLERYCADQPGISGFHRPMQWMHRLILVADLLPFGLQRRKVDRVMQRSVQMRRAGPVWWYQVGWHALRRRFDFHFCGGGFYVIHGRTLMRIARRGWLDNPFAGRDGLVGSEEDVFAAMLATAVGDPVLDLRREVPDLGTLKLASKAVDADELVAEGLIVHPVKGPQYANARDVLNRIREQAKASTDQPTVAAAGNDEPRP